MTAQRDLSDKEKNQQQIQKVWQLHCQTDANSLNLNPKEFI